MHLTSRGRDTQCFLYVEYDQPLVHFFKALSRNEKVRMTFQLHYYVRKQCIMFVSNDLMLSPFTFARHHSAPKSSSSRCSRTDHIKLVIVYLQVALFGHGLGALSVRLMREHFHLDNIPANFSRGGK